VNWSGADMAMIKIAAPATLHPVELADSTRVALGEHIIVLGYPGISLQQYRSNLTEASGSLARVTEEIAKPTVTDGIVSNIGAPLRQEGGSITGSTEGDVYQLSDLATGQGNSGGPVFNSQGQVIGMFTSETIDGIERATYAVPISYGLALMQVQH
jgi:serine protease Do